MLYKLVDGIELDSMRDTLFKKGTNLTLEKSIDICRADEVSKKQMKLMSQDKEIGKIDRKKFKTSPRSNTHIKPEKEIKNGNAFFLWSWGTSRSRLCITSLRPNISRHSMGAFP